MSRFAANHAGANRFFPDISDSIEDFSTQYTKPMKRESTFRFRSNIKLRSDRSSSHDGSSTESGDDSSVTTWSSPASPEGASSDSEIEQIVSDAVMVFPVAMLLRLGVAAANASGSRKNVLGYATQAVPEKTARTPIAASQRGSWLAQPQRPRFVTAADADEVVIRKARSILNKLTIEKFDSLYEQLATCGIQTTDHLRRVMREVFEKATVQHHFIPMYADLCMRIEADERIVGTERTENERSCNFRSLLLDSCQTAFEELLYTRQREADDDEEARLKRKQKALGNVKLVGQLIVRGMLSPRLLVQCAEDLLKARNSCSEALESLAAFLEVSSPTFDNQSWPHWQQLDVLFRQVTELSKDKSIPARERFLLRDVVELRQAGWPGRSAAIRTSGPMRLEEVRTKAEAETSEPSWMPREAVATPTATPINRKQVATPQRSPAISALAALARERQAPARKPVAAKPLDRRSEVTPVARAPEKKICTPPAPPPPPPPPQPMKPAFCPIAFRRVLAGVMKELAQGWNVPAAVNRIREQQVPADRQAAEFVDIITRAAEEFRGPARRSAFAFAAGLAAADGESAFDRNACLEGTAIFFREVYEDLCEEVPRLAVIMKSELLPTLRSVLPPAKLCAIAPADLWT